MIQQYYFPCVTSFVWAFFATVTILYFIYRQNNDGHITTIGVDFKIRTILVDGSRVRVQIWDTAGQERFRTIAATYYRGSHGVIVVFDLTNLDSFEKVKIWLEEIKKFCVDVPKVLVGNKCDQHDRRLIKEIDARQIADELSMEYFETSAKENVNIDQMFTCLIRLVVEQRKIKTSTNGTETVDIKSNRKRSKKCC